jgi:hypothetical protein
LLDGEHDSDNDLDVDCAADDLDRKRMHSMATLVGDLRGAVDAALQFDYQQDKDAPLDSLAGVVKRHMTARFMSDLLVVRPIVEILFDDILEGRQVLLVGANGSGKSTTLLALDSRLRAEAHRLDSPIDLIVFNGNLHSGSLLTRRGAEDERLFILDQILKEVSLRVAVTDENSLTPEWMEFITAKDPLFAVFNSVFLNNRRQPLA